MTFEEAIEIIKKYESKEYQGLYEVDGGFLSVEYIIDKLQETYAPKIKMTFKQKDNLMLFIYEDDDFEDFWFYFGKFSYGIGLYKEFTENELMQAWLHPELIEVVDD